MPEHPKQRVSRRRLADEHLEKLARNPDEYRRSTSDTLQPGLYARPRREIVEHPEGGGKPVHEVVWVARSQRRGSAREKVLGRWPRMSVEEARAACAAFRLEERGIGVTWATAAQGYLDEQTKQLVSQRNIKRILLQHFADLARVPLDELRREQVTSIVSKFAADAPDTAAKLLQKAKALTRWAAATGLCEVDRLSALDRKIVMPNFTPATGQRVLSDDELRAIFADEFPTGALLRAQALTAARIGEVLAFDATQIDADGVWRRPREEL